MSVIIEDLSVSFGDHDVLHRVSCRFQSGNLTALVGPSGSGKTTLLYTIAGVLPPDTGSVRVYGEAPNLAFAVWVPQGANALPARSLLENAMIAPLSDGVSRGEAEELCMMNLESVGLAGRTTELAATLSGGELQRLSIARALSSRRPLLIADEPTANLDVRTAEGIIELLASLKHRKTIIVATHDPALVDIADRIVDLKQLRKRDTR